MHTQQHQPCLVRAAAAATQLPRQQAHQSPTPTDIVPAGSSHGGWVCRAHLLLAGIDVLLVRLGVVRPALLLVKVLQQQRGKAAGGSRGVPTAAAAASAGCKQVQPLLPHTDTPCPSSPSPTHPPTLILGTWSCTSTRPCSLLPPFCSAAIHACIMPQGAPLGP